MSRRSGPSYWRWMLGAGLLVIAGLTVGCGGGDTEGNADFRQNFEKPSTPAPPPKVSKKDAAEGPSPRQKRFMSKRN